MKKWEVSTYIYGVYIYMEYIYMEYMCDIYIYIHKWNILCRGETHSLGTLSLLIPTTMFTQEYYCSSGLQDRVMCPALEHCFALHGFCYVLLWFLSPAARCFAMFRYVLRLCALHRSSLRFALRCIALLCIALPIALLIWPHAGAWVGRLLGNP